MTSNNAIILLVMAMEIAIGINMPQAHLLVP
jgi:hypothetical protein